MALPGRVLIKYNRLILLAVSAYASSKYIVIFPNYGTGSFHEDAPIHR